MQCQHKRRAAKHGLLAPALETMVDIRGRGCLLIFVDHVHRAMIYNINSKQYGCCVPTQAACEQHALG
jgi:hypothetical protein